MDVPRADTPTLIHAMREIAGWFGKQAADAKEDADHWGSVIRKEACQEAADRLQEMHDASAS